MSNPKDPVANLFKQMTDDIKACGGDSELADAVANIKKDYEENLKAKTEREEKEKKEREQKERQLTNELDEAKKSAQQERDKKIKAEAELQATQEQNKKQAEEQKNRNEKERQEREANAAEQRKKEAEHKLEEEKNKKELEEAKAARIEAEKNAQHDREEKIKTEATLQAIQEQNKSLANAISSMKSHDSSRHINFSLSNANITGSSISVNIGAVKPDEEKKQADAAERQLNEKLENERQEKERREAEEKAKKALEQPQEQKKEQAFECECGECNIFTCPPSISFCKVKGSESCWDSFLSCLSKCCYSFFCCSCKKPSSPAKDNIEITQHSAPAKQNIPS